LTFQGSHDVIGHVTIWRRSPFIRPIGPLSLIVSEIRYRQIDRQMPDERNAVT